jgi:signal transduction histidine kinase/CheY-like chemotaxis protein
LGEGKSDLSKSTTIVVLFMACVALMLFLAIYSRQFVGGVLREEEARVAERLRGLSAELADLVSGDTLGSWRSPEVITTPEYLDLRDRMIDFAASNGVVYAYFLRPVPDGRIQYIIDNDLDPATHVGLETPAVPMDDEAGVEAALAGRVSNGDPDRRLPVWKGFFSAYAPVFDSRGQVVAAAGIDLSDVPIVRARRRLDLLIGLQIMVAALVSLSGLVSILGLRRESRAATAANQSKSVFLAHISHEIRTPMNAIIGIGELLSRLGPQLPAKAQTYVSNIKQASGNLLSIINDILDLSRIESGRFEIVAAPWRLSRMVADVVNIGGVWLMDKSVRFEVFVDSRLPDRLVGDSTRVRQVVLNLLSNAVKYTVSGHVSLSVEGAPTSETSILLVVKVTDTGIGIKGDDLPSLFDEFVRLEPGANLKVQGTGLGLAIVRNLCQLMGGRVHVDSRLGFGSVFSVELPQRIESPEPLARVADAAGKSVLVYDRRPLYAESAQSALDNLGVARQLVDNDQGFLQALQSGAHTHVILPISIYSTLPESVRARLAQRPTAVTTEDIHTFETESVWYLYLPLYSATVADFLNASHLGAEPENTLKPEAGFTAPRARVLIVDDLQTNLMVMEGLLFPYGLEVDLCRSGAEAVEMVKERPYDLVFMDHLMAGMDGLEAARRIRALEGERFRTMPIVAMTANLDHDVAALYHEWGMSDYLAKPIETPRLTSILLKWLPWDKIERRPQ